MASRLVWAKNLDFLRFSYRRIVVRCNPLKVWNTKTLEGRYKFKNSKKKESLSRGILSSQGCRRNSVWRRAASHRDGGDDVGSSTSGCSREAGGSALQNGHDGKRCFSIWLWNHFPKQSWCMLCLQHGVFSLRHTFAQMAHSSSSMT